MAYVFATVVVTNAVANAIRQISRRLDRNETDGMFTSPLSASGNAPATHFISTGQVPAAYLNVITNPTRLFNAAKAAYERDGEVFPFTQQQVINQLAQCDVSQQDPFAAMTRLGLKQIETTP